MKNGTASSAGSSTAFPAERPRGLRLRPADGPFWRIDTEHPDRWEWRPFPTPRHRFDPPSARFRVRYAANRAAVAARERFPTRALEDSDGDLWLVRLDGRPSAVHLTHQINLDALGLDDRVSTGRIDPEGRLDPDPLLDLSGRLADAVWDWWAGRPPPIAYRARTVPSGRSLVFTETTALEVTVARRLREAAALHQHLVLCAGFTVPERWLE